MEEYKEHYTTLDNLANKLAQDGVAVIKDVINQNELVQAREGMWQTLNKLTQNLENPIQKNDHTTWKTLYQLYPKHSMLLQNFSVGHSQFIWDIRQNQKVNCIFKNIQFTGSSHVGEKLSKLTNGKVKLEDAGFRL